MSTPILPYAVWEQGTNNNSVPANDNALRSEILAGLVLSKTTTAQPAAPAQGAIYIIPAGATGAQWATFAANDVAIHYGGTWYAFAPVAGLVLNMADGPQMYSGAAWTSGGYAAPGRTTLADNPASSTLPTAGASTPLITLLQMCRDALKWITSRFNSSGRLSIAFGGTGAGDAPSARTALGVGVSDSPVFANLEVSGGIQAGLLAPRIATKLVAGVLPSGRGEVVIAPLGALADKVLSVSAFASVGILRIPGGFWQVASADNPEQYLFSVYWRTDSSDLRAQVGEASSGVYGASVSCLVTYLVD